MVPTDKQVDALWDKYRLPPQKRVHMVRVARVAIYIGKKVHADLPLLRAAALLHDIDKAVPKIPGERHPDGAVRILREEGMNEVADIVATHSLHAILDPNISPGSLEQKILYLADKMVRYDIVGVDKRFALWNAEHLPPVEQTILDASYPKVKKLEQEVFNLARISLSDILGVKERNL